MSNKIVQLKAVLDKSRNMQNGALIALLVMWCKVRNVYTRKCLRISIIRIQISGYGQGSQVFFIRYSIDIQYSTPVAQRMIF